MVSFSVAWAIASCVFGLIANALKDSDSKPFNYNGIREGKDKYRHRCVILCLFSLVMFGLTSINII